jgi:hypothetical protein
MPHHQRSHPALQVASPLLGVIVGCGLAAMVAALNQRMIRPTIGVVLSTSNLPDERWFATFLEGTGADPVRLASLAFSMAVISCFTALVALLANLGSSDRPVTALSCCALFVLSMLCTVLGASNAQMVSSAVGFPAAAGIAVGHGMAAWSLHLAHRDLGATSDALVAWFSRREPKAQAAPVTRGKPAP